MGVLIHWIGPKVLLFASLDLFLVLGLFAPCFVIEHNCTRFLNGRGSERSSLYLSIPPHIAGIEGSRSTVHGRRRDQEGWNALPYGFHTILCYLTWSRGHASMRPTRLE